MARREAFVNYHYRNVWFVLVMMPLGGFMIGFGVSRILHDSGVWP